MSQQAQSTQEWPVALSLRPLSDLVVVRPDPPQANPRHGSLVLPSGASAAGGEYQSPMEFGTVVAVGPGAKNEQTGERMAMRTRPGERVAYPHHPTVPVYREAGQEYLIMHEPGLFGVLVEEKCSAA